MSILASGITRESAFQQQPGHFPTEGAQRRPNAGRVYFDTLPGKPLSPRERQVVACLCEGLPNKLIAYRLGVTTGTLKGYMFHIMAKTRCASRLAVVVSQLRAEIAELREAA